VSSVNRPPSPATGAQAATRSSPVSLLLRAMRPHQWTKNLLVCAGSTVGFRLGYPAARWQALGAFVVFCALSSAVYLLNDVRDREADRVHPVKSKRPIASGDLSVNVALTGAVALTVLGLGIATTISPAFAILASGYLLLMGWYTFGLKHVVILDVIALAGGFVLRAAGGAVAVDVTFSHWLLLLTLLLALFLALSKRRAELVTLTDDARSHRRILSEYSPYLLDQMIGVVTASTLLAYAFYTISPETLAKFGTDRLLWTVPFPLYGIFRYLYLVHQRAGGGSPSDTLLEDRPILICVALWATAVIAILYGPLR
jgi:4-hydroxybenzoate polyprenyltransferase